MGIAGDLSRRRFSERRREDPRIVGCWLRMIEEIGTAAMGVALLAAFAFILGAFALLVWGRLRGRRRGWLRVMAVVVLAPACALAATVISAVIGWAVAATLAPEEQQPTQTEQRAQEAQERTSAAEGGRGSETTTERRSASPTATPSASPTASPTSSPTATASPSP